MQPIVITPRRFEDHRGWFSETWSRSAFEVAGIMVDFCQDNHSLSRSAQTLRGMHFQTPPYVQTKLVRCLRGAILDVLVDVRRASPTFGCWRSVEISAANGKQLLIPGGYAHGFLTLEPETEIAYKVDAPYSADNDAGFAWNDPEVAIFWPIESDPILSEKDRNLPNLADQKLDLPYDGYPLGDLQEILL